MKNTLNDLNNYLFEQIERLNDDELTEKELEEQIRKSESINKLAKTIVDNASLSFQHQKMLFENGAIEKVTVPLLEIGEGNEKK